MNTETATDRLTQVKSAIEKAARNADRDEETIKLVAVSKTFDAAAVKPLLDAGHRIFGENRVQEAATKWPSFREDYAGIELHLIGPLQSNKCRQAVGLFDVIETVDREKIATTLAAEIQAQGHSPRLFVQINTGDEPQKAGIAPQDAEAFVARCRQIHGLAIDGLMCIPPVNDNPGPHFALIDKLATKVGVQHRSMGMSSDYETAIGLGATVIRVGSAIFGVR